MAVSILTRFPKSGFPPRPPVVTNSRIVKFVTDGIRGILYRAGPVIDFLFSYGNISITGARVVELISYAANSSNWLQGRFFYVSKCVSVDQLMLVCDRSRSVIANEVTRNFVCHRTK